MKSFILNLKNLFKNINSRFQGAVSAVIVINLVLAVTALFKDVFTASYLGTSSQADAFLLAYFLPDMAGNNILASSLGIACVPVFSRLLASKNSHRLAKSITGIILYFTIFSLLLIVFSLLAKDLIIRNLGSGLDVSTRNLCTKLFVIMLPIMLVYPIIAIGTAVMQVYNRFIIPALAPVVFNLFFLSGLLYGYFLAKPLQKGVYAISFSILVGVMAMITLIWGSLRKYHIRVLAPLKMSEFFRPLPEIKDIFKIFFPYVLILMSSQLVFVVERYLASNLGVGIIAGLNYAFRLAQFPLWVFVSAVSVVAFPSMSKATGMGKVEELKGTLSRSVRLVLIITVPLTICLFVLRVPIVSILLQRGSFEADSVRITAGILAGYALTVVSQGFSIICVRAFLAVDRALVTLLVVLFSSGLNIIFDFYLVNVMGWAGLGYGAAIGSLVNAVVFVLLLNRTLTLDIYKRSGGFLKIMAANIPVLLVVGLFYKVWFFVEPNGGFAGRFGYVCGVVAVGLPLYLACLRLLRIRVMDTLNNLV